MNKLIALGLVAAADIARSIWAFEAFFGTAGTGATDPWLSLGLILISGGMSLALLGLAMRAALGFRRVSQPSF